MYSFEPNEEQKMLIDAVSRYAENDLRASAEEAEEGKKFPDGLIEKGWEMGILQASIPEVYGGFGEYSSVTGVLAAEELAYGDLAGAMAVMTPNLFVLPILLAGSEEQKMEFIPPVIEMEWKAFTAALIEPSFDFDATDLKTTATVEGDDYLLSGHKTYVPYAAEAEAMIVYANVDGLTQGFIVPAESDGLVVGEERNKLMSLNALPFYDVRLNDVRVPKANRLEGDFEAALAASRVALAALAVGVAKASLDYAIEYAKEREVFGVKVAQKQAIAFMLAEMAMEIEASRMLTWEAAWKLDNDKDDAFKAAYLAATGAIDMVMMVTDRGVQVLGGHGYIREHPVERWMRNGRGFATFTGLAIV
ncbi:MAG: acyl-CoA dehydrogenase family protein [Anaerolineales bacterium]|uniref:Acyl-CoA dehydrogenase family protein n=1 Tax=Candidatus Desulfolinea nitratireducens TaxID=2841698 RepID=A0A8J6NKR9_9CHLR|nr:acyl-CoA dehydrogenase family protein [Candidatus Desulfolinea nitratireducens]MBL6961545.1 acyl-CoA dehydrogenase family protein [Anaerolineales bacterium]